MFLGDNPKIIAEARAHFNARNETFQKQSDLFVDAIHCGRVHISNISPFGAGLGYSPLPDYLKEKKAIVNVRIKMSAVSAMRFFHGGKEKQWRAI